MPVLPNQPLSNPVNQNQSLGGQIGGAVGNSLLGSVGLNPYQSRQNTAQMFNYTGRTSGPNLIVNYPQASYDWRVRLSLAPNSNYFYNDPSNNILRPLTSEASNNVTSATVNAVTQLFGANGQTRVGVVFPYTPVLTVQHTATYSPQKLTHSNYTQYFYDNSEVSSISIAGEFTVQNVTEGQYLLACIYFFRSITKMFFGQDPMAGNPPPIVFLNGYGQYYLPNVPCVVTSFSHTMPAEVDYMDIPEPGLNYNPYMTKPTLNSTRLPTTSTITLNVQPVYSRLSQSQGFGLNDFARGALINGAGSGGPATSFGASQKALNGGKPGEGGFI